MERTINHLIEIEKKAEEIIVDKSEIIALDKRRNANRESLRALEKQANDLRTWMAFGPTIMKLPKDKVKSLLEEDQKTVSREINRLRSNLKVKVSELQDLEYQPQLTGFSLKPLSVKELEAMKHVWGER